MAIPLVNAVNSLIGLTSLTDAMALGMPVVMTKNSFVEVDIEKEEAGYWVDPGNFMQWREKVKELLESENLEKFSRNSRKLAENSYNAEVFFKELLEACKDA
jgi:glycosyltransferase involved in cell wall biosynthesis